MIADAESHGDWVVVYCPSDCTSVNLSNAVFTETNLNPSFR